MDTMKRSILKLNASDVAAVIGENKWKSREEVFERIAIENGYVECVEDTTQDELETLLTSEVASVLHQQSPQGIEASMKVFEEKTKQMVVTDLVLRSLSKTPIFRASMEAPEDVTRILADLSDPQKPIEATVELCMNHPTVQRFLSTSDTVQTLAKSINTIRGRRLEDESTNKLEDHLKVPIQQRNSRCYIYRKDAYILAGRVDGLTEDAVVETKTRRRKWAAPPPYDLIQLRCYMKLCEKEKGILNERFPDGTHRTTTLVWDQSEWDRIESKVDDAVLAFMKLYA